MIFIEVEELPEVERRTERDRKDLRSYIEDFMSMNTKIVWVVYEPHEYASPQSAARAFRRACSTYGFPVDPCIRNDDLYLVRNDI